MALTISTGFVVDDAIVVTENIARYVEAGDAPVRRRAQGRASRSASPSSRSPSRCWRSSSRILLMGGIVGRLFREFAVTLAWRSPSPALVSLTLTPDDVRARSCRLRGEREQGRLYRWSERAFEGLVERLRARTLALRCCATSG